MNKVCSKTANWIVVLMLIVPGSVLHAEDPPSSQDQTGRNDQPASTAPIPPALRQALASSLREATSIGAKTIPTPPTGTWGIVSAGDGGGGIFRDSDSEAEAWLGSSGYGISGYGSTAGGYFKDSDNSGYAYLGVGNYGIQASGTFVGAYFEDSDASGYAYVAYGNNGLQGFGTFSGGYFGDSDSSGYSYVGYGDRGIHALGSEMGGYFKDSNNSGYANVGEGDYGIRAYGNFGGGHFEDLNASGYADVGYGNYGIRAHGNYTGGYFRDLDGSGIVYVGYGDYGIQASGNARGGYFYDANNSGYSYVAVGDVGIQGFGSLYGGSFYDTNASGFAQVGLGSYKILGTGAVSFVQNHPYDPSSVIVYASPEGDEAATYTRGTARLVDGEATVPLGETFKWVTNPDIGLTAHLTPRGEPIPLAVVELSTEEMTVRAPSGAPEGLEFDFMVYGLRIGFEELSIVQEKTQESYITSMADHRQLYERRPDLKNYNSLERFKGMNHAINPKAELNLSRAQALRDAIIEFDPAIHELPWPPRPEEMPVADLEPDEGKREGVQEHEQVRAAQAGHDRRPATGHSNLSAAIPVDDEGNVYAPSFRPSSQDLASLVRVSETVERGDVLVIDTDRRGLMRRGSSAADNGVVGIVAAAPGVALGSELEIGQTEAPAEREQNSDFQLKVPVAFSGVVDCKVDASYGAVWTGNLLVTSPTPGHAMAQQAPLPGTVLGKALEPLQEGAGTIKVLVMLR